MTTISDNGREVVAIVQTAALGDLIVALPMACALKRRNPSTRVLMIGREYSRPLVEASSWVDGYLDAETVSKRPEILREQGVSVLVNPKQSIVIGVAARRAGVKMRIGKFSARSISWANRYVRIDTSGCVQRHRALLNLAFLAPLGIRDTPTISELGSMLGLNRLAPVPPAVMALLDRSRFNLVLHPKSNGSGREWPAAHYDRLVDLLPRDRVRIFVTGRPAEREALIREQSLLNRSDVIDLTGRLDLAGMISFLHAADGFIASGTGPLHIAAGVGTRTLGLFPGRDLITAARWHPLGPRGESLSICQQCRPGPATCPRDFGGGPCACLIGITPEQVAARVLRWLDQVPAAAPKLKCQLSPISQPLLQF